MAAGARGGVFGGLVGLVQRLRAVGGKALADVVVVAVVSAAAAAAALYLGSTTPVRFVENVTYDLRLSTGAPPAQPDFVIVKMDDAAVQAMSESSACHCLAPIDKAWLGDLIAALDAKGVKEIGRAHV